MNRAMARSHPVTMILGAVVISSAIAARRRIGALEGLLCKAERWAYALRHELGEIAIDADTGRMAVRELLSDGEASEADQRQLTLIFDRIAERAMTGGASD
jgi:hypothetical protein